MLRGGSNVDDGTWNGAGTRRSWREIDRDLRAIAKQRCALDGEEAVLLRAAARMEIWHELGKASLLEYLEEVLGYSPRAASERVRVARVLAELPGLAEALTNGELHWSAVRELSRVVTPMTEAKWLADVRGKNLRAIEQAVAGRKRGDLPTDPEEPDLRPQNVSMQLRPATIALMRQAQHFLADERGEFIDDDAFMTAAANALLGDGPCAGIPSDDSLEHGDTSGRARYQIMTVLCSGCGQGFQDAGGRRMPIEPSDVERAECDAQRIGSDAAPERATQDVSPKVQRFVRRRDGGKCCVPGCRSARFLEIHHVVRRVDGGSHEADNLTLLCDGHHKALHDGKLTITGRAPKLEVRWLHQRFGSAVETERGAREMTHVGRAAPTTPPAGDAVEPIRACPVTVAEAPGPEHLHASRFAVTALKVEVKRALVKMKFKSHEATKAVELAATKLGSAATLELLLFTALQCCPKP